MPEQAPPPTPEAEQSASVSPSQIYRADHFQVEIAGIGSAQFVEVSGLAVKVEAIPFRGGGEGQVVHYLTGQLDLKPLECRYGVTQSAGLWQWMESSMRGEPDRRTASLIHLDSQRQELSRWNIFEAWPTEFVGADLRSMESQFAIETIKIVYEMIERV